MVSTTEDFKFNGNITNLELLNEMRSVCKPLSPVPAHPLAKRSSAAITSPDLQRETRKIIFVLRIFPTGTFLIFEKNGRKTPVLASTFLLRKMMLIKHPEQIGKLEFQTLTFHAFRGQE